MLFIPIGTLVPSVFRVVAMPRRVVSVVRPALSSLHTMAAPSGPTLDRSTEPWVGVFPGLGTVRVHADGAVDVEIELDQADPPEDPALREAALRHGWAEPLGFVRQGYRCAWGSALAPPDGHGCLIVNGTMHDVAVVLLELVSDGWSVLADHLVPARWVDGRLVAFPADAPVLVSDRRARRRELKGTSVRAHTDAVRVDVPRAPSPQPVRAVVVVGIRRPDDPVFEDLLGHERFSAASQVLIGGVMKNDHDADGAPRDVMGEHLDLSKLRFARLRFDDDTLGADVAELTRWWSASALPGGSL